MIDIDKNDNQSSVHLQFVDFSQKSTQLANSLIYMLKSIDEADKKNVQMHLDTLSNSTITFSPNEVETNISVYLDRIRKSLEENEILLQQIFTPYPQLDTGNVSYNNIYKNLQHEHEKLKQLEKITSKHMSTTKSMSIQPKNAVTFVNCSNFEIFVNITNEINKTPITNQVYTKIKPIWYRKMVDFFNIFDKVNSSNMKWGDIPQPIKFTPENTLTFETITFLEIWYKQGSVENSLIEFVSSDLADVFNDLLLNFPEIFESVFKDYAPFASDKFQTTKKFLKLFQEKFNDYNLGEAKGQCNDKLININDDGILSLAGNKIKLTTFHNDHLTTHENLFDKENFTESSMSESSDFETSNMTCVPCNDEQSSMKTISSDDEIFYGQNFYETSSNVARTAGTVKRNANKRSNRKNKKSKKTKAKTKDSDLKSNNSESSNTPKSNYTNKKRQTLNVTSADLSKLMGQIRITFNNTSQNFQNLIEDINNIFVSLDKHASHLFKMRENPSKKIFKNDLEIIIGRCDSMLTNANMSSQLENAKTYFKDILLNMIEEEKKSQYRQVFINSLKFPEFCSIWGYVLEQADKRSAQFNRLTIIKENNYNSAEKKLVDNTFTHFKFFEDDKYLEFYFNPLQKETYVTNQYNILIDKLKKEMVFFSTLKQYILQINEAIEKSPQFAEWFSDTKTMEIKKKYFVIKDLSQLDASKSFHPIITSSEFYNDEYLRSVFLENAKNPNILVSWPPQQNSNWKESFNEMIRGFYGQVFFLDPKLISTIDNKQLSNIDFNPSIHKDVLTRPVIADNIYPSCYSYSCPSQKLINDIYHEHRIEVYGQNYNYPKYVQFRIDLGYEFNKNMSLPNILLLQYNRENFGYENDTKKFNLAFIDKQLNELEMKLIEIDKLKTNNDPFKLNYDLYVKTDKSMAEILAYANADRVMINQGNTLTFVQGPSGSGKSNAINGNNSDKKGFFESISAIDSVNTKCEPIIFEFYHVAMPFRESFEDSTNTKVSTPRIWYFKIDKENPSSISQIDVENFKIYETIPIETYNRNFSVNGGIRETIDNMRKNTTSTRMFPTIYKTVNNPESSRSTYIQAMKLTKKEKSSYNIVLDRPGEEDPYTTFEIKETIDKIKLSNPFYAVTMNLGDKFFKKYPSSFPKFYFNAIGFVNFEKKTFSEYLFELLKEKQTKSSEEIYPNLNYYMGFTYKKESKELLCKKYLQNAFCADLDRFFDENSKEIVAMKENLENYFKNNLPKDVYEFLTKMHKNQEWLDFVINVENFKDNNDYATNMYINGFAEKSIQIKDLFPMNEYKQAFTRHVEKTLNESNFCKFFFEDNFFNQLLCPLLGWLLNELSNLVGMTTSKMSNPGTILEEFLLTPNNVIIKHGNTLEMSFVDHSAKIIPNSSYNPVNTEFKLGFDYFMGLCKFGRQSFLNSWNSIASFLLMTATYFSIFKNNNFKDYYDKKIEYFTQFSNVDKGLYRKFFEAVSINEINANQRRIMSSNVQKPTLNAPTLNTMFYNTMYLMSDLIVPKVELTKLNRNLRFTNLASLDLTYGSDTPMHFRLEIPFKILKPIDLNMIQVHLSNNSNLLYSMTQVYTENEDWLVCKKNWEEQAKLYYITDATSLVRVMIFNCYTASTPSGNLSYYLYF